MRLIMMNAPSAHSSKVCKGREPFDGFSKGKALGKARQRLSERLWGLALGGATGSADQQGCLVLAGEAGKIFADIDEAGAWIARPLAPQWREQDPGLPAG